MENFPRVINEVTTVDAGIPDDALILAASWEERCLSLPRLIRNYTSKIIILSVYDNPSSLREGHIEEMTALLAPVGILKKITSQRDNLLPSVRQMVRTIDIVKTHRNTRISIDISTFTRKHLFLLLQGLDLAGMLNSCQLFYTEQKDYHTQDDEPIAQGISTVKAIETYLGSNNPSRDSLLVLFLGYEGRRALALWEHIDPNITLAVIAAPPFRQGWEGRAEVQNQYLLSCLPKDQILRSHSLDPSDTEKLLNHLVRSEKYNVKSFNYIIAPLGTKPQTLGIYRFWRKHRGVATIMYASPIRYREEQATFPPGRTWLIDRTEPWESL